MPEHRHWTGILNGRTNLAFTAGLPGEAAAFLSLPLDAFLNGARYTLTDGSPYAPPAPEIHHRNETLLGPGDAILMGKKAFRLWDGPWSIVPGLGLSVPLGRTEENPIQLGHEGRWHQHIQFGSGTFDPMAGLEASYNPADAPWGVDAWALARQTLYANEKGYLFGGRLGGGIYPRWHVFDGFNAMVGAEAVHEGADQWRNAATGQFSAPENSGRQAVMAVVGVSWRPAGWDVAFGPQLRKIVWQRTLGGEMDQPLALSLSMSYTFGAPAAAAWRDACW